MNRGILMGAGALVALGFLTGSAMANFMFGMSLGRTWAEGLLLGSVGVCAVVTNALCPFFLSWSVRASRWATAASIMLLYILCLIYSVTSAAGFVAQSREGVSASRQVSRDAYDDTRRELLDLENRRKDAKPKDRIQLDAKVDDARRRLKELRGHPPAPADAQSAFLSALTFGLISSRDIRTVLSLLFALVVEVGATVGLFAALSHPPEQPPPAGAAGRWRPRIG